MRGMKEHVIMYDAQSGAIKWDTGNQKDIICTISTATGDRAGAFLIWAKASAANMNVVETIEGALRKHKEK